MEPHVVSVMCVYVCVKASCSRPTSTNTECPPCTSLMYGPDPIAGGVRATIAWNLLQAGWGDAGQRHGLTQEMAEVTASHCALASSVKKV